MPDTDLPSQIRDELRALRHEIAEAFSRGWQSGYRDARGEHEEPEPDEPPPKGTASERARARWGLPAVVGAAAIGGVAHGVRTHPVASVGALILGASLFAAGMLWPDADKSGRAVAIPPTAIATVTQAVTRPPATVTPTIRSTASPERVSRPETSPVSGRGPLAEDEQTGDGQAGGAAQGGGARGGDGEPAPGEPTVTRTAPGPTVTQTRQVTAEPTPEPDCLARAEALEVSVQVLCS